MKKLVNLIFLISFLFLSFHCGGSNNDTQAYTKLPLLITAKYSNDFGEVKIGETSLSYIFNLTNNGSSDIKIDKQATSDILYDSFSYTGNLFPGDLGNCTDLLKAGATCEVEVVFTPRIEGFISKELKIYYDYEDSYLSSVLVIKGTGFSVKPNNAYLTITPETSFDFGELLLGEVSVPLLFYIKNVGYDSAFIDEYLNNSSFTGSFNYTNQSYPGVNGTCGNYLKVNEICTVELEFTPNKKGLIIDNLNIFYNDNTELKKASIVIVGSGLIDNLKIYLSGTLNTSQPFLYRLLSDGIIDNTFSNGYVSSGIYNITKHIDNKILISGSFNHYNGIARNGIARVNSDGSLDNNFDITGVTFQAYPNISAVKVQADNKILIGGYNFSGNFQRVNEDGSLDENFSVNIGVGAIGGSVDDIFIQNDGKIIVAGSFTSFFNRAKILRLNSDGTLDESFNLNTTLFTNLNNSYFNTISVDNNGGIIITGGFIYTYNSITHYNIIKLNSDGSINSTFINNLLTTSGPHDIRKHVLLEDQGIIIIGSFQNFFGVATNCIIKLNNNGTISNTFFPGSGFQIFSNGNFNGGWMDDLSFDSKGRITITGGFTHYNGTPINNIARLNSDGSLDETFAPGFNSYDHSSSILNIE